MDGPLDAQPAVSLGIHGPDKAARLARLLDGEANSVPTSDQDAARFLTRAGMHLITDRRAAHS